jgi:hypothetical protein
VLTIPFLKIVVSGLITTESEPAQRSTLLAAVTTFNATVVEKQDGTDNSELAKQILALSQIESYQLPLPSWTTTVGAIAQLDTASLAQLIQSSNTTIKLPLEVMSAELDKCNAFDNALHLVGNETIESAAIGVMGSLTLPTQCGEDSLPLFLPTLPGWFGRTYLPAFSSSPCGPYIFVYGRTQPTNASLIQDITVIQCSYTVSMCVFPIILLFKA